MTSIKPPSSGLHIPQTGVDIGNELAADSAGTGQTGEVSASESFASESLRSASAPQSIPELARAIQAGALTADQAVDKLVDQTLARVNQQLSAAQLTELSGLLRDALLSDPTLRALRAGR
jgi:hypothetical protein